MFEPLKAPTLNGGCELVKEFVTDMESHSKISPVLESIETGEHPALGGSSNASDLLDLYTKLYDEEISQTKKKIPNIPQKELRKRTKRS